MTSSKNLKIISRKYKLLSSVKNRKLIMIIHQSLEQMRKTKLAE